MSSTEMQVVKPFPRILGVRWFNLTVLTATPAIALWGFRRVPLTYQTMWFSVGYFMFSMLGGYRVLLFFVIRYITEILHRDYGWYASSACSHKLRSDPVKGTTAFGLTVHIPPPCLFNFFSYLVAHQPSKDPSSGGLVDTGLIIDTPTPTWTHTIPNAVYSGHTSDG